MKQILEISKIVTKKRVKKIEIFDEHALEQKNSKFNEFYEALIAGKFQTDEDAAEYLYNSNSTDDKFRQLKSRFKKRLLNTLFFLDINQPASSNYNRAYYSCNKDWTLVKILLSNRAYSTAAQLARQILLIALKFKFADVIVNSSRILRDYYSTIEEDEKKYEEHDQYCKQYQHVLDAEIRSEELYQRVVMNYYKPPSKNKNLEEKIDIYCDALEGLSQIYDSPVVHYNRFMVWAYRYEMLGQYTTMLEICNKGLQYMEENPDYYREDKLAEISIKKVSALLHLRQYQPIVTGNKAADKFFMTLQKTDVWFELMEYHFLLCMHTEEYEKAIRTFEKVVVDKRFKDLDEDSKEKWNCFESYLNYLFLVEESLDFDYSNSKFKRRKRFKVNKFLEEPLLYPKSQRILKVVQMIAQVLFLVEEKNYAEAQSKVEILKTMATRQLKKEEQYRTAQFIRLLHQLAKANFNFKNIGVYKKYLTRIEENTFTYRALINELEIIPYEKLWRVLLKRLSKA